VGLGYHHLPSFNGLGRHLSQIPLAVLTAVDRIDDHLIRRGREQQGPAGMTSLSTGFLATGLAQAPLLAPEPIRRGGQVTIVTVFRQALFECVHLLAQVGNQLLLQADGFLWQAAFPSQSRLVV
jgi:hypothetical protein